MFLSAKKSSARIILFLSFLFVSLFLLFSNTVFAATLGFSPSSGSYSVGSTIKVRLVLSTPDQSANAVSASLTFSKDLLTLTSISKTDSLVTLWASDPTYSNSDGTADMEGIILNGYTGGSGTIVDLYFKATAQGTASIKFATSSVLANDGQGTNILTGAGAASFIITPAVIKVTPPAPVKVTAPAVPATATNTATVINLTTPIFTDYSKDIKSGDFLVVKGFADPNTKIIITSDAVASSSNEVIHESNTTTSDSKGIFTYVSGRASEGTYTISAQAENSDGILSDQSDPITISVSAASAGDNSFTSNLTSTFSLIIPIVALLVLLILLIIWGWYRISSYRAYMSKRFTRTRSVVSKSFDILGEDAEEEAKIFKKIKALQPLTTEERTFFTQFKKDLQAAERAILNDIR